MFASRVKKVLSIVDGEESIFVTIRKLSARSLDHASEVRQGAAAAAARAMGPEMLKSLREEPSVKEVKQLTPEEEAKQERASRYASYDRYTVLQAGIDSWTAKEPLASGVSDLDEETADKLYHEIIDLSIPAPAVAESQLGKD